MYRVSSIALSGLWNGEGIRIIAAIPSAESSLSTSQCMTETASMKQQKPHCKHARSASTNSPYQLASTLKDPQS
eukprot:3203917-Pleurochrysis_carterae.AAC.1